MDAKAIKQSLDEIQAIIDAREQNLADWDRVAQRSPHQADEAFMPAIAEQDELLLQAVPELMEYARAWLHIMTEMKLKPNGKPADGKQ